MKVVLQTLPSDDLGSYNLICLSADAVISVFDKGDQEAPKNAFCPTISCLIPQS